MVIFNSYVKLTEGNKHLKIQALPMLIPTYWQIDSYPLLQGSLWAMALYQSWNEQLNHLCQL